MLVLQSTLLIYFGYWFLLVSWYKYVFNYRKFGKYRKYKNENYKKLITVLLNIWVYCICHNYLFRIHWLVSSSFDLILLNIIEILLHFYDVVWKCLSLKLYCKVLEDKNTIHQNTWQSILHTANIQILRNKSMNL